MKGICGKLLDIDLTSGKTKEIGISDETARRYLGGRGLGARLLFDLLPAKTDPLSPDNILIFLDRSFYRFDGAGFIQICRGDQVAASPRDGATAIPAAGYRLRSKRRAMTVW